MVVFYPKTTIRRSVGKNRFELASQYLDHFQEDLSPIAIESKQIDLFNAVWEKAQGLPFYAEWRKIHQLPTKLNSISELNSWPLLSKDNLRANLDLVKQTPNIVGSYRTSGSTGEPFDFPRGDGEFDDLYATMWSFRNANNLQPFDASLVVSTTITNAAQSRLSQFKTRFDRMLKDAAGNAWHVDGFIATPETADRALRALRITRPKYLIGFPSGIANMARRAEELGGSFPFLTHAILTSETIDLADIQLIERAFKVKVLIEYGATEIGVIAGTDKGASAWPLKVNWWSTLATLTSENAIAVTTLSPRAFPLINYALGDVIETNLISPNGSILGIENIQGRTRDTVSVFAKSGDMKKIFAREITYLVRDLDGVESVQVAQTSEGEVQLYIVAPNTDPNELVKRMSDSLRRNQKDIRLDAISIQFIEAHIQSARGKRGVVISAPLEPTSGEIYKLS